MHPHEWNVYFHLQNQAVSCSSYKGSVLLALYTTNPSYSREKLAPQISLRSKSH